VGAGPAGTSLIAASHPEPGDRYLYCDGAPPLLFTENETNTERIFGTPNASPHVKDGINNCIVQGQAQAVNPAGAGTKATPHYRLAVPGGGEAIVRLRLTPAAMAAPFADFDAGLAARRQEADAFYASVLPASLSADEANVMRQALAGMLWSKQFYYYDVNK
jgi:hypothetical protein